MTGKDLWTPTYRVGVAPLVGDGNPATAYSLLREYLRTRPDNQQSQYHLIFPQFASALLSRAHQFMTHHEGASNVYTNHSEDRFRSSLPAYFMGWLLYRNFLQELEKLPERIKYHNRFATELPVGTLNVVQEHLLLGMPKGSRSLIENGFPRINLYIPDSVPKKSAERAARKHPTVKVVTWLQSTYDHLQAKNHTVVLSPPTLVAGMTDGYKELTGNVPQIVVKTSGSGIPQIYQESILTALEETGKNWEYHHPGGLLEASNNGGNDYTFQNHESRLRRFYKALLRAQILISYPNEQIQALYELKHQGKTPRVILLPPRGEHEINNILTALAEFPEQVIGILVTQDPAEYPWVQQLPPKTPFIQVGQLAQKLQRELKIL